MIGCNRSQALSMTALHTLDAGPTDAACRFILAHGAGAGMDHPFLDAMATLLAERAIATTRFEFAYMAARRITLKRTVPPKAETLVPEYERAIAFVRGRMPPGQRLVIGGKSMGGRVASLLADAAYRQGLVTGLVCLGYPFHPPKKSGSLRTAHLIGLTCPTLIVQGERDPFGGRAEVEAMTVSPAICFHWAPDGDHDLSPRRSSGFSKRGHLEAAADAIATFIGSGPPKV